MKKKKTYEISVIDKTYSNTITDETKFYTSDTALELGFELKETEYDFESAEIVLLNIDDRSLTTRPVSKVNNDFVYEIDDDITTHYGEWRGQLMLVEKGEVHVSSPIKFRIENDLYSNKPLEITEVVSWVSLKKYANVLVDELKQAVDEAVAKVETMDETFKANELDRDKAEKERQDTFEDAESERDETFSTNETTRQTQELEREKAESQRQSVFDGNEASRSETFSANEATRQANETTRQQAERERQSAESSRVSAEEQRETDHANRSAELAGKADKKQEDWITPTLMNGFTGDVRYRKTQFGHLEIYGRITSIDPINSTKIQVFSLPSGYSPDRNVRFEAPEDAFYSFRNARMYYSTYGRSISVYAGQGGSSWHINVSIPIN